METSLACRITGALPKVEMRASLSQGHRAAGVLRVLVCLLKGTRCLTAAG